MQLTTSQTLADFLECFCPFANPGPEALPLSTYAVVACAASR